MVDNPDVFGWLEWIIVRGTLLLLLIIGSVVVLADAIKYLIEKLKTLW